VVIVALVRRLERVVLVFAGFCWFQLVSVGYYGLLLVTIVWAGLGCALRMGGTVTRTESQISSLSRFVKLNVNGGRLVLILIVYGIRKREMVRRTCRFVSISKFLNNLPFVFRYILFRQRGLDSTWRIIGVIVVGACFALITNEAAKNENEMDCFQVVKM
jgi:hypothetical protein